MKRVLISGASSGLGRALALTYATPGATVGLIARRQAALEEVAAEVEKLGARALVLSADVTDRQACADAVADFCREAGGIELAIANAGIGEPDADERLDVEAVARVLSVNLLGVVHTLLPCIEPMTAQGGGTLVGMASVAAFRTMPGSLAYSTSKSAVMTFMEGLSLELAGTGIHAMSLCPGFVRTPLTNRNEFKMPFLLETEDAARRMRRAIEQKRACFTFPLPMKVAAGLLRIAPHWLLHATSPRSPLRRGR